MATTTTTAAPAAQAWHQALKLKKHLSKQLDKLRDDTASKSGPGNGVDLALFEAIDSSLEKLRLACVQTIFLDPEYAVAQETEKMLWQFHTFINSEYRRTQGRLRNSPNAVEKRKVEKMYNNFLRIAQKFYKGYVQRLSARYDVPQLKRAALGIEVESMTASDVISPVPQGVQEQVLKSCHATLIRLGDLARYRIQARHKKSGYETALTYYSLAQDLMPSSGLAIHQMSIVNLDEGNHLDAVYHLYRAWAIAQPHPMAKPNLESEFKSLEGQSTNRGQSQSTPLDVLTMWFLKLHALFYKGEVFQAHKELEGEVIHRLEMAAKRTESAESLLKMVLTNIAAYHIASIKFGETQNANASRCGQYNLNLNARFIITICNILEAELEDANNKEPLPNNGDETSAAVVDALLPLLRTYCTWLAGHLSDFFGATQNQASLASAMIQSLARVFTLLCDETYKHQNPASCPYLLAEDLEYRGLLPLCDEYVPQPCRSYCSDTGETKPHPPPAAQRLPLARESLARLLDILRCAYFMAEDSSVPLFHRVQDGRLVFEHQAVQQPSTAAPISPLPAQQRPSSTPEKNVPQPGPQPSVNPGPARSTRAGAPMMRPMNMPESDVQQLTALEANTESTVLDMLEPFLRPPTPELVQSVSPGLSHGGGQTANMRNTFSSFSNQPSPTGSVGPAKFEPLPWKWVYTPKPAQDSTFPDVEAFDARPSPNPMSRSSSIAARFTEDPFLSPAMGPTNPSTPQLAMSAFPAQYPASTTEEAHRNDMLALMRSGTRGNAPAGSWASPQLGMSTRKASGPSTFASWGPPGLDHPASSFSEFSHPSSLYQNTPTNGLGLGPRRVTAHELPATPVPEPAGRAMPRRDSQMAKTTSTYDAAVFKSAYYSGK